jgi:hypothetical protein
LNSLAAGGSCSNPSTFFLMSSLLMSQATLVAQLLSLLTKVGNGLLTSAPAMQCS